MIARSNCPPILARPTLKLDKGLRKLLESFRSSGVEVLVVGGRCVTCVRGELVVQVGLSARPQLGTSVLPYESEEGQASALRSPALPSFPDQLFGRGSADGGIMPFNRM